MDIGSAVGRKIGLTEEQLRELPHYRESAAFSDLEKLVIEFGERMTATPVEISDALFERLRRHFNEAQIVELAAAIAWENFRARFDHALGIESQNFTEGAFCVLPERPPAELERPAQR